MGESCQTSLLYALLVFEIVFSLHKVRKSLRKNTQAIDSRAIPLLGKAWGLSLVPFWVGRESDRDQKGFWNMKHNLTRLLLCGVILILTACTSLFSPGEITTDEIEAINAQLTSLADQSLFTGVVLIGERGEILLSKGYGLADRAQNTPILPAPVF
jgi:hypothetical protein